MESDCDKIPDVIKGLRRKLIENSVLTGSERKFLLHLIQNSGYTDSTNGKWKRAAENDRPVKKANKRLQVDIGKERRHCSYTQTDIHLMAYLEKPSTSKGSISESKRLSRSEKMDEEKVRQLMNDTFEERRHFIISKNPVLHMVKDKYPLLFSTKEVINELNRIFYDKKDEEFLLNIRSSSGAILSLVDENDAFVKTIKRAIDAAITNTQKSYARQVGAILMISNILHEKRTYLDTEDEPGDKNCYPRIEASCEVSKLFEDVNTFRIFVEGLLICEASTFPKAILCLIACYFIFNISYPDLLFNTFVVMEKIFLDANDTDLNEMDEELLQIIRLIKLKTSCKRY